jgi:hypothetical protein
MEEAFPPFPPFLPSPSLQATGKNLASAPSRHMIEMDRQVIRGIVTTVMLFGSLIVAWSVAGVAIEVNRIDSMLRTAVNTHTQIEVMKKKIADAGYDIEDEPSALKFMAPTITATGPTHSVLVYSTHLTVTLGFDLKGRLTSYHLERA